jgi:hypothetical protein
VAWSLALTVEVVAGKLALLDPAGMVTLEGASKDGLLLERETVTGAGAALSRDAVQVADALLPKVDGAHASVVN